MSLVAVLDGTDQLHWRLVSAYPTLAELVGVCRHMPVASAVVVWCSLAPGQLTYVPQVVQHWLLASLLVGFVLLLALPFGPFSRSMRFAIARRRG